MSENKEKELIAKAQNVRERAYPPVTGIKFGAAILTRSGKIHVGCNIEEYGLTLTRHAEMMAVDSMLSNRENDGDDIIINKLVIVGDPKSTGGSKPLFPCALCRQHISPFSDDETTIIAVDLHGNKRTEKFRNLLPEDPFKITPRK